MTKSFDMTEAELKQYYQDYKEEINYMIEFREMGHANILLVTNDINILFHRSKNEAREIFIIWSENFSAFERIKDGR